MNTLNKEEKQLLVDVSVLYYLEGKTQSEIAKQLFLSRPKVSRLLKKAREKRIVDISINYETDEIEKLKGEISRKFNVDKVIIVKTLSNNMDTLQEIGKVAAKQLETEIKDGMTVGFSWGKSVRCAASYLKRKKLQSVKIVELFGAINYDRNDSDMLSIGRSISSKVGGELYPLPAPIYIHDDSARKALVSMPVINNTLQMVENCDLIISGLGVIDSNALQPIWDIYVEKDKKDRIKEKGGIGFICAHFFDKNGNFLDDEINSSVIGIKTESIKKIRSMIIAGGKNKAKAILAALRGECINILISDEDTLRLVLEYSEEN
ncbi:MAG: sugar-binding transcriptional regulator [Vallitalea sp.]|jgi:DNA-binding transcriptional regulator LsrR (DeoR family)|nr:sugar-binding transcriptional regulator [Vallitalea sp.]